MVTAAEHVESWFSFFLSFLYNNLQENIKTFLWSISFRKKLAQQYFPSHKFSIHKQNPNVFIFLFYEDEMYLSRRCSCTCTVTLLVKFTCCFPKWIDQHLKLYIFYSQSCLHGRIYIFFCRDAAITQHCIERLLGQKLMKRPGNLWETLNQREISDS